MTAPDPTRPGPDRDRALAEAERFLRDRVREMAWHDDSTNDAVETVLAEYDRRGEVVAAASALVEHWQAAPKWRGADYAARNFELLDALAAAVGRREP